MQSTVKSNFFFVLQLVQIYFWPWGILRDNLECVIVAWVQIACSGRPDSRAPEKNSRRKKNDGNLTRSPLTAALYYLNAWNTLERKASTNERQSNKENMFEAKLMQTIWMAYACGTKPIFRFGIVWIPIRSQTKFSNPGGFPWYSAVRAFQPLGRALGLKSRNGGGRALRLYFDSSSRMFAHIFLVCSVRTIADLEILETHLKRVICFVKLHFV